MQGTGETRIIDKPTLEKSDHELANLLNSKRVVIVEDEGITQLQLKKVLSYEGLVIVASAMSGPQGVESVLKVRPDIVIMDIQMPGEYNGLEAAKRILEEVNVCVVMLTAFSEQFYVDQAEEIGVCGYIIKPVDRDTLIPKLVTAYKSWQSKSPQN